MFFFFLRDIVDKLYTTTRVRLGFFYKSIIYIKHDTMWNFGVFFYFVTARIKKKKNSIPINVGGGVAKRIIIGKIFGQVWIRSKMFVIEMIYREKNNNENLHKKWKKRPLFKESNMEENDVQ